MALTTKTLTALVQSQVTAMQAACSSLLDFAVGTVLLAFTQAMAGVGLWLQALLIQVAALTRLATSYGADVDSFIADFGMTRLPPVASTGPLTFARFSTTGTAVVPVGTSAESADDSLSFIVTLDTTNPAYVAGQGYVLQAGVGSVTVPAIAVVAGSAGNVAAGVISVISDAVPGIDTVTNGASFTSGADAESDAAVKLRFVLYINSRPQGTAVAVDYAIESIAQNLTFDLVENETLSGSFQAGYFYVVVDDGSTLASVPQATLQEVSTAVNGARPLTSQFGVFSRTLVTITISMVISGAYAAVVQDALIAYVQSLGLGATVEYNKLAQIAYNAAPAINIVSTSLNGGTSDVICAPSQRATPGAITVALS
jgi:hypothetical protein